MSVVRSSKCSIAFSTQRKRKELESILSEYGHVVNHFIDLFWTDMPSKAKLLKGIVNSPTTWLTARLRKVAAREAIDMILAAKERWKLFGVEKKEVFFLHRNSRYENTRTALFARNNNVNQGLI